jgi:hypothetical protein
LQIHVGEVADFGKRVPVPDPHLFAGLVDEAEQPQFLNPLLAWTPEIPQASATSIWVQGIEKAEVARKIDRLQARSLYPDSFIMDGVRQRE